MIHIFNKIICGDIYGHTHVWVWYKVRCYKKFWEELIAYFFHGNSSTGTTYRKKIFICMSNDMEWYSYQVSLKFIEIFKQCFRNPKGCNIVITDGKDVLYPVEMSSCVELHDDLFGYCKGFDQCVARQQLCEHSPTRNNRGSYVFRRSHRRANRLAR
jgi:hypothetical protein